MKNRIYDGGDNTKIDWENDMKDTIWSMFWISREHGGSLADEEFLKENVARLIKIATQKSAGQRKGKKDIDWNALQPTLMNIALAATAMCLDGVFGEMPKYIEEP